MNWYFGPLYLVAPYMLWRTSNSPNQGANYSLIIYFYDRVARERTRVFFLPSFF